MCKGELVVRPKGFDYSSLEAQLAGQVRSTAERIRQKVKKTLDDLIDIGNDLKRIKDSLNHGQFGRWLQTEFGWTERTARNFMAVAEHFGKTEIISDLQIQPTAAYLLAAPSARTMPDKRPSTGRRLASGSRQRWRRSF